jgi:hypothetical protein
MHEHPPWSMVTKPSSTNLHHRHRHPASCGKRDGDAWDLLACLLQDDVNDAVVTAPPKLDHNKESVTLHVVC